MAQHYPHRLPRPGEESLSQQQRRRLERKGKGSDGSSPGEGEKRPPLGQTIIKKLAGSTQTEKRGINPPKKRNRSLEPLGSGGERLASGEGRKRKGKGQSRAGHNGSADPAPEKKGGGHCTRDDRKRYGVWPFMQHWVWTRFFLVAEKRVGRRGQRKKKRGRTHWLYHGNRGAVIHFKAREPGDRREERTKEFASIAIRGIIPGWYERLRLENGNKLSATKKEKRY